MGIPRTIYVEPGDTLWLKDAMPMKKVKVLAVIWGHDAPFKDMVWVEDKESKERLVVLSEWLTDLDPEKNWSDTEREPDETSFHSLDNLDKKEIVLKNKEQLSSEKKEGKLPHQILASALQPVHSRQADNVAMAVAQKMSKDTGVCDSEIDKFLKSASYGCSPDGTYWVYDASRRVSFRLDEVEDVKNLNYYIGKKQVRAPGFFRVTDEDDGITITALKEHNYLLSWTGDTWLLDEDDLGLFCADHRLDYGQVKSSLHKTGKWSFV